MKLWLCSALLTRDRHFTRAPDVHATSFQWGKPHYCPPTVLSRRICHEYSRNGYLKTNGARGPWHSLLCCALSLKIHMTANLEQMTKCENVYFRTRMLCSACFVTCSRRGWLPRHNICAKNEASVSFSLNNVRFWRVTALTQQKKYVTAIYNRSQSCDGNVDALNGVTSWWIWEGFTVRDEALIKQLIIVLCQRRWWSICVI